MMEDESTVDSLVNSASSPNANSSPTSHINNMRSPTISPEMFSQNDDSDDDGESPPRKTRSLVDIYESCTYALMLAKPTCYEEACEDEKWQNSMKEELNSIEKNNTWDLVDLPRGKQVIGVKWVYKVKFGADGNIQKYKSRLVVKGYAQKHGIDFFRLFLLLPILKL